MTIRIPVRTQEPVKVTGPQPVWDWETVRITRSTVQGTMPYGSIVWVGPELGWSWEVQAIQIEVQADANAGNRDLYVYLYDMNGNIMRQQVLRVAANTNAKAILTPYAGAGTYTEGERMVSSAYYTSQLIHPMRVGVYWGTFQGAGDVVTAHILVKRWRNL